MFDDGYVETSRRERNASSSTPEEPGARSWYADPHGFSATAFLGRRQRRRSSRLARLRAPASTLWSWAETAGDWDRSANEPGREMHRPFTAE
jgi:hypothetical protein